MPRTKQMELLKSKVDKIARAMKKFEDLANSEINSNEEYFLVERSTKEHIEAKP